MKDNLFIEWLQEGDVSIPQVFVRHYKDIGLDDQDFITIIQIKSFLDKGEDFSDPAQIASNLKISNDQAFRRIHTLIQKKVLSIQTVNNIEGKSQDKFDFTLLYEKLFHYLSKGHKQAVKESKELQEKDLYQMFEREFGRPLSPMEFETINMWIDTDHYDLKLIQMALKEAVLNQAYSLKYVDRILLNWQKKNIKTPDQVKKQTQAYRQSSQSGQDNQHFKEEVSNSVQSDRQVPLTDWLADYRNKDENNS